MADDDNGGKTGYKIIALVSSLVGAQIARKVLTLVWTKTTGKEPPANPEHPDVTWAEAAAWAGVSGVVVALAKLVAQRQAAATWHRASGQLPPGLEETAA
jgi:NhaP-type Na+/H+ or K+/H+ antiporter